MFLKTVGLAIVLGFGLVMAQDTCPEVPLRGVQQELRTGFPENIADPESRKDVIEAMRLNLTGYYDIEAVRNIKEKWDVIETQALAATNEHDFYTILRDWLASYDKEHTFFQSAKQVEADNLYWNQPFAGIGATVTVTQSLEGIIIQGLRPDGPAIEAGLKPFDRILRIDGVPCPSLEILRGTEDTEVELLVQTPGEEPRELTLVRRLFTTNVTTPMNAHRLESQPSVGYLSWSGSEEDIFRAMTGLSETTSSQQDALAGFILDLRFTAAGEELNTLNEYLGFFVKGLAYVLVNSLGNTDLIYATTQNPSYRDLPVAVLVNSESRDASVWIAAVLQQRDNTVVIGEVTGRGEFSYRGVDLPDGSYMSFPNNRFALKISNSSDPVFLEDGRVTPDILIQEDPYDFTIENDPYIKAALEELAKMNP